MNDERRTSNDEPGWTYELVGGSRDGTVVPLVEGRVLQWLPEGPEFEDQPETVQVERYEATDRITARGYQEMRFVAIDTIPWSVTE